MTLLPEARAEHSEKAPSAQRSRAPADPIVSIIINNYNYAAFVGQAINSALQQTFGRVEVLVVDDGSTDNSRSVIAGFGNAIHPIFKENGGQASALNVGVSASRGEIICLLDSDDLYFPGKVRQVVDVFMREGHPEKPMLVHHLLKIQNDVGRREVDRRVCGTQHGSPLNLYPYAQRYKYVYYAGAPTSGLCLNRNLATKVFPLPEKGVRVSADDYIVKAASLIGELYSLAEFLGAYRVHGANNWYQTSSVASAEFMRQLDDYLNRKLEENGLQPVICYAQSMYAWRELVIAGQWTQVIVAMIRECLAQRDFHTLDFAYKALRRAIAQGIRLRPGSLSSSLEVSREDR